MIDSGLFLEAIGNSCVMSNIPVSAEGFKLRACIGGAMVCLNGIKNSPGKHGSFQSRSGRFSIFFFDSTKTKMKEE